MTASLAKVRLADVLTPVNRGEPPRPGTVYRQIGVRLWGAGAYERERIDGSETKYARLFRAAEGDIVVNKIWARNGSVAVITSALAGCYGSNEFPLFAPNRQALEPRWMHWLTKTPDFWHQCDKKSQGTSGKNRIRPEAFLEIEIPLPPLAEQRRLVARIEEVAAQVDEMRSLRKRALVEAAELVAAEESRIWPDTCLCDAKPLGSVTGFLARGRQAEQGQSGHFLIKTQHVQQDRYIPTSMTLAAHAAAKVKLEAMAVDGDILIACSAAGCLGRAARYRDDGRVASTDTHVAVVRADPALINPDYLYAYLRGTQGQHQLRKRERGDWQREKIGFRLTELNLTDLRSVPVPIPSRSEQDRLVAYLDRLRRMVDGLKRLQAETGAQAEALLRTVLERAFNKEL